MFRWRFALAAAVVLISLSVAHADTFFYTQGLGSGYLGSYTLMTGLGQTASGAFTNVYAIIPGSGEFTWAISFTTPPSDFYGPVPSNPQGIGGIFVGSDLTGGTVSMIASNGHAFSGQVTSFWEDQDTLGGILFVEDFGLDFTGTWNSVGGSSPASGSIAEWEYFPNPGFNLTGTGFQMYGASPPAATPEPSTWIMLFSGIVLLGYFDWKQRCLMKLIEACVLGYKKLTAA
jgi:hypothetical protein